MAQKKNAPKGQKKESKPHQANKNGKKADVGGGASFFTWFMVLAVLGVWTSVAVVYFDLVDYQGVIAKAKDLRYNLSEVLQGKLVSYDTDGDGDFDMEDAKVLVGLTKDGSKENSDSLEEVLDILAEEGTDLFQGFFTFLYDVMSPFDTLEDEETEAAAEDVAELSNSKAVGVKLMEALKQQLAIIHERVEARKIAKMALAEVRSILAKEEEERTLTRIREESEAKAWERAEARLKEEGERIVKEDVEKAMEKIRLEKEEREKAALRDEAKRGENEEVKEKLDVEKPLDKMLNEKGNDPKKAAAKKKP